jgi:hypothetical protein
MRSLGSLLLVLLAVSLAHPLSQDLVMTCSSNIVELDQFRRVHEALTVITRPIRREMQPPRVVDWYLPGMLGKTRVSTAFGDLPV